MQISDILTSDRVHCCTPGSSKKRVLEYLAEFIAQRNQQADGDQLYEQLLARERLGSTGIGEGVAIPHCRLAGFDAPIGVLLKLQQAVDFDAIDGQPVDIVFALVVPAQDEQHGDDNGHNDEHLKTLSTIAELLQDQSRREQLRAAIDDRTLFELATQKAPTEKV